MSRQSALFAQPARPRRVMMRVADAGAAPGKGHMARLTCVRCDHDAGWLHFDTVSEVKRGLPCPKCNVPEGSA